MPHSAPPLPPQLGDDELPVFDAPAHDVNFRLWQIGMSAATIVVTGWFFTLNPLAGIIAFFIAKHVLVAILAAGLTTPTDQR